MIYWVHILYFVKNGPGIFCSFSFCELRINPGAISWKGLVRQIIPDQRLASCLQNHFNELKRNRLCGTLVPRLFPTTFRVPQAGGLFLFGELQKWKRNSGFSVLLPLIKTLAVFQLRKRCSVFLMQIWKFIFLKILSCNNWRFPEKLFSPLCCNKNFPDPPTILTPTPSGRPPHFWASKFSW